MVKTAKRMAGMVIAMTSLLIPKISAKYPDGTAATRAPMAKDEPTHEASSIVNWTFVYGRAVRLRLSDTISCGRTGEVHTNEPPKETPPRQTGSGKSRIIIKVFLR